MATYYVSKTDGNDSNAGTAKTRAVATIGKAFELAAGSDNTIEIIDSSTYHPTASITDFLPGHQQGPWANMTFKAGTDTDGNKVYPVISGKQTNESGSIVTTNAIRYEAGWTVEGLEIRDCTTAACVPNTSYESTLIIRDCVVHHIRDRENGGSTTGCIDFSHDKGDETTNIVERCQFFEIGKYVIAGNSTEDILVRNCLIALYGGSGSSNNSAVHANSTGSIVEHCTISDYQGGSNVHMVNLGSNTKGIVRNCIFNKIDATTIVDANRVNSCLFANITTSTSGNAGAGRFLNATVENDIIFTGNLTWGSGSSVEGNTSEDISAIKDAYILEDGSDGLGQASGSTTTYDIRNNGKSRSSRAATYGKVSSSPDIGCYQLWSDWTNEQETPNANIDNDFTINDTKNLQYQYKVKLDSVGSAGEATPPVSKAVVGTINLRGRNVPYKVTKGK